MKILLVLMGLDIGGAETHVVSLAKGLKEKGIEPIVVSNGGIFEGELEKSNIRHVNAPLHNKNIFNMIKSYFILRKLILTEKPDVVHGHARIPSFLLGILNKFHKFNFVTTAHWVFETKGILKYISDWGYRTVAVSEDIKQYLFDNYNIAAQNVTVTINGIDTDCFSEEVDCKDIIKEFSLSPDRKKIVYISRLDKSRSLAAHALLDCAFEIYREEKVDIIIVGDGDDFESIKSKAMSINRLARDEFVRLAGARTDINKFTAVSDIFIGVSRSALEAMSTGVPCIIAGNEGYIGIFNEEKLDTCIETNFCLRGCAPTNSKVMKDDIFTLLNLDKEELKKLGSYGREVVLNNYSVDRMANDNIKVYKDVIKNGNRYYDTVISGYYGHKNSGDDALLSAIIKEVRDKKADTRFIVLSKDPKETKKVYGVDAVNRFNPLEVLKAVKFSSLLISGGGSLIQDATSTKSLLYYLFIIKLAFKYNLKTMIYANGIGPVINKKNITAAREVLNKVDFITLRENKSVEVLKSMGVTNENIKVTSDPSVSIEPSNTLRAAEIFDKEGIPRKAYFVVSVRKWKNYDIVQNVSYICDYICEKYGLIPVFVPMQLSEDVEISEKCLLGMKKKGYIIKNKYSFNDIMEIAAQSSLIIGMRLHILMYGANRSVPVIGIVYDPKVDAYLSYINQKYQIDIRFLSGTKVCDMVDDIINNYKKIIAELDEKVKELKELSLENGQIAAKLIEENRNENNIH